MRIPYSREYIPPTPILIVAFALPDESPRIQNVSGFVDTGADITIVPTGLIEELDAPYQYSAMMRAFVSDSLRRVSSHTIDIMMNGTRIPSIDVISDDLNDQVILGRNFLNKMRIVLDGPKSTLEV